MVDSGTGSEQLEEETCSTDEARRKQLVPVVSESQVLDILNKSYVASTETVVKVVCQLDSYDDCNWKVEIDGSYYVLKVHNGVESLDFLSVLEAAGGDFYKEGYSGSPIHFQNAIAEILLQHGIPTVVPVNTLLKGKDACSPVAIHTLPVLDASHSPARLAVRLFHWVEGRCMSDIPLLPLETLADAGRMLGRVNLALDQLGPEASLDKFHLKEFGRRHSMPATMSNFVTETCDPAKSTKGVRRKIDQRQQRQLTDASLMVAARRYHQWDGKNTSDLRKFVHCIRDESRRSMVESVIDSFEQELINNKEQLELLREGIIMGDYNDANILVDRDLHVCGVIDFGDSVERYVVEVAVLSDAYNFACHTRVSRGVWTHVVSESTDDQIVVGGSALAAFLFSFLY